VKRVQRAESVHCRNTTKQAALVAEATRGARRRLRFDLAEVTIASMTETVAVALFGTLQAEPPK
jgi:hypothetical protein